MNFHIDVCIIKSSLIVIIMFLSSHLLLSVIILFCPFAPFVLLNFSSFFLLFLIHKQVKHMNVFCQWDLFGHDVNLYYFLNTFSTNVPNIIFKQIWWGKIFSRNILFFEGFSFLSCGMYVWSFIWWWWWEKIFFLQLSNSIIEYSCRIFCMKIVCYYYCIIFVYQQQQRGSFFNMILGYMF